MPKLAPVQPGVDPGEIDLNPPERLGESGKSLWNRVQREYGISDVGGMELLFQACAAADRAAELQRKIDGDSCVVYDAKGNTREHPCLKPEMACPSFIVRTLMRLGVTSESIKPVGRPGGRLAGWKGPHPDVL